jgi:hypothetical protein
MKLPIAATAVLALLVFAAARGSGQWEGSPATTRQWFQSLTQPDNPAMSCCGEADAFEADASRSRATTTWPLLTAGDGAALHPARHLAIKT